MTQRQSSDCLRKYPFSKIVLRILKALSRPNRPLVQLLVGKPKVLEKDLQGFINLGGLKQPIKCKYYSLLKILKLHPHQHWVF